MAAGLFLAVMSTTLVSVALPAIGHDLHASPAGREWIVDAYVIVYASLLAAGGVLGDRHGRKGLFVLGAGVFGAGALVCGLAPGVGVLLAGRVLQGAGPALLVPGSLTIVRAAFADERRRAAAIGVWSTASGLALALGPPAGGLIVDWLGWRWVFLVNVPLAVIVAALAGLFVPRLPRGAPDGGFDWAGACLVTAALATLAFATIEGQVRGWSSPAVWAAFGAGVLALAGFAAAERRRPSPLIDVSLFARPAFAAASIAAFAVFFAFVGAIVYFSAYFQQVQGLPAIRAGWDVAAIGASYAIAATTSGRLVGRVGERWPLVTGLVVAGVATMWLVRLGPATPMSAIGGNFAVLGAGIGLCGTPMSTIAMSAVGVQRAGMASAIINSLRQIGQIFGIAVLGALVYAHVPGGSAARLGRPAGLLFVAGLHRALWVCAITLLATAAAAAALLASWPFRRHRPAR